MNLTKVKSIADYPIKCRRHSMKTNKEKPPTFFCAIVGLAFTLFISIASLIIVNYDHQIKTSFPSDSEGRVCGFDLPKFPLVYFTSFPRIQHRLCVAHCPSKKDTMLNCVPTENSGCSFNQNPQFYVGFYENEPQISSVGSFCVPKDKDLKEQFYKASNIGQRFIFLQNLSTIVISCLVALGLGIIYTLLVQKFPLTMNKLVLFLGCILVLVMVTVVMIFPNSQLPPRIGFSALVLILLLTVYFTFRKNKASLPIHGAYLKQATKVLGRNIMIYLYIPIFMAALVLFLGLVGFELRCLWSSSGISFSADYLYYQFKVGQTTLWSVLVFVQALWGLSFVKQAFNFCVSGNSVQWYYSKINQEELISQGKTRVFAPLKTLIVHHFGSVVAGSFLTGWFSLFDYIFDCLRPDNYQQEQKQGYFQKCINHLDNCLDLVRSDSMGYIYLTGNPYCNSSRYCQFLCENSQSASRAYRICAHLLLAGLVATVSILLQGNNASVYVVVVVFLLSLFLTTFFISLHADSAQSIQIVFLMDQYFALAKGDEGWQGCDFGQQVIQKMGLRKSFARQIYELRQASREAALGEGGK